LLTGQDCICNSSSSDRDISILQHAEDSNKLQKHRIIHRDEPSDSLSSSSSETSKKQTRYSSETSPSTIQGNSRGFKKGKSADEIGRIIMTVSRSYHSLKFTGKLDESVFLHIELFLSVCRQLNIPTRYRGAVLGSTLSGSAITYFSESWDMYHNTDWKFAFKKLKKNLGSIYHIEAADAVLRELTLRKVSKQGELIMDNMEVLLEKLSNSRQ
jgi:hypothetical protein